MIKSSDMRKSRGARSGILSCNLPFRPQGVDEDEFYRADIVFEGVDHSDTSYEVLVFLNNTRANDETPHTLENGYAGRFVIFGHGGCFGDEGHCHVVTRRPPHDLRAPDPLIPVTKVVVVTKALKYILENDKEGLEAATLIPISETPLRKDRGLAHDLFKFDSLELRTYK